MLIAFSWIRPDDHVVFTVCRCSYGQWQWRGWFRGRVRVWCGRLGDVRDGFIYLSKITYEYVPLDQLSYWSSRSWLKVLNSSPLVTFIVCFQCQKIVIMKLMPYCTLLLNFLQGKFIIRSFMKKKMLEWNTSASSVWVFHIGMERTIRCSILGLWKLHLKKPFMEKLEMWVSCCLKGF